MKCAKSTVAFEPNEGTWIAKCENCDWSKCSAIFFFSPNSWAIIKMFPFLSISPLVLRGEAHVLDQAEGWPFDPDDITARTPSHQGLPEGQILHPLQGFPRPACIIHGYWNLFIKLSRYLDDIFFSSKTYHWICFINELQAVTLIIAFAIHNKSMNKDIFGSQLIKFAIYRCNPWFW